MTDFKRCDFKKHWGLHSLLWILSFSLALSAWAMDPGEVSLDREASVPSFVAQQKRLCRRTDGIWSSALLSCECPKGHLFFNQRGCTPVHLSYKFKKCLEQSRRPWQRQQGPTPALPAPVDWAECFEALYQENLPFDLSLKTSSLVQTSPSNGGLSEELLSFLNRLQEDPTFFLKGFTFPETALRSSDVRFSFSLFRQGFFKAPFLYWEALRTDVPAFETEMNLSLLSHLKPFYFSVESPDVLSETDKKWLADCQREVAPFFPTWGSICLHFIEASRLVFQNAQRPPHPSNLQQRWHQIGGPQCSPECHLGSLMPSRDPHQKIFGLHFVREGIPITRTLSLKTPDALLMGYFSPLGGLESLSVSGSVRLSKKELNVLKKSNLFFDPQWHLLEVHEQPVGHRARLTETLSGHFTEQKTIDLLPNELEENDQKGLISLLMVENGWGMDNPIFYGRIGRSRLLVESEGPLPENSFLQKFVNRLSQDLFSLFFQEKPLSYHRSLLSFLDEYPYAPEKELHGTSVASVLLQNLLGAKLHLLTTESSAYQTPEDWIEAIRKSQARIVNMSFFIHFDPFQCEQFFEKIFAALPEVLFVIASSNYGLENPPLCPIRLGSQKRFQNVLTVAGHDDTGRLHPQSTYGFSAAKVAAPYSVPCLKASFDPAKGWENASGECSGTSFSAAFVSNKAARLLLLEPQLTAQDVAQRIQGSCQQARLPVQCGGPIVPERFLSFR